MIKVTQSLPTLHIKSNITLEAVLQQKGHHYLVTSILDAAKSFIHSFIVKFHRSNLGYKRRLTDIEPVTNK
jgi:citrate lyase synthetase